MAILENLTLDTLVLNDGVTYTLESADFTPPPRLLEWVRGSDSDGSLLARVPLTDNRVVTLKIRIEQQSTMDLALAKIGAIVDKLQEAEQNVGGISLTWTPADSTKTITFEVLSGEVTDLPVATDGDGMGWFVRAPVITVKLTCHPCGYGAEVVGTPTSLALPLNTIELTGVTGDVPAEARLIVTDNATQARRTVRWGLESRFYPTSSPPVLILESDNLVTTGFAGTGTTRTGAYDPGAAGNNVIRATLANQTTAVCGTGNQTHVGTYRLFARVWVTATNLGSVFLRASWQDGDGPLKSNTYATPPVVNNWAEVDLGLISIGTATLGTQRWTGRIDAFSSVIGDTLDVDYVALLPAAEGYGVASGTYNYSPGTLVARDDYASGGALNARVAPVGGTWATSGAATDWAAGTSNYTRTATGLRFSILGATNYTDVEVGQTVAFSGNATAVGANFLDPILFARWTDSNNHVRAVLDQNAVQANVLIQTVVAGVVTAIASILIPPVGLGPYACRFIVYASGLAIFSVIDSGGAVIASTSGKSTVLATGGTLATGKPGFGDSAASATTVARTYDNFYVSIPAAEPIAINTSQSIEFRSDSVLREDASGTYWGQPPRYQGSDFEVPVAGTRGRKTRVAVMAKRNDTSVNADDQVTDSTTIQVNYTPRWMVVPR